ncbi:MAG: zinc-binding dehydrogenase [Lentisphaeria bacterium]|nr:zinc-binding dehydrogenase [Lentisphaeria bacterium]
MNRLFEVVAHRGCRSLFPENTLEGFRKAIELGVDAIEFDVHPTRDRKLVITHDDTIDRCSSGTGLVRDYTLDELRAFDFGLWKGEEFRNTRIPTLEEVLDLILAESGPRLQILIELKENDSRCTEQVLAEIRRRHIQPRTIVLSNYANQLKYLHSLEPGLRLQGFPMECYTVREPDIYDLTMRVCLFRNRGRLTHEAVKFFHDRNIEVDTVPVNTAKDLEQIREFDLDTITTDAPDVIMPLLREQGLRPLPVPEKTLAWRLYGAGLENFGDNGAPVELPVRPLREDEILMKVEALGLCFSDIKIIRAGGSHPKLWNSDLRKHPLIVGHEAVLTVVKTGSAVPLRYAPGRRFLIQCDIHVNGRSCAYGYGMDGGLAQYSIVDSRVWKGETESYLLDCPDNLSPIAAALLEPWTCVRAAYHIPHRTAPADRGTLLLVTEPGNRAIYTAGPLFRNRKRIVAVNFSEEAVRALAAELGSPVERRGALPESEAFDDIVCADLRDAGLGGQALALAGDRAVVSFLGNCGDGAWKIDVGALHYRNRFYQGAPGGALDSAYSTPRRQALRKGGCAWFPGGAGAMGQMHVELAILSSGAPSRILVTDMDDGRIGHLRGKLAEKAEKQGVELEILNPRDLSPDAFTRKLKKFAPAGFDDIVILVPSARLIDQALPHLADNGLLNVFAGIPAGESSQIPVSRIIRDGIRFTGSSGSSTQDMKDALAAAERHEFEPQSALAAIAGFRAARQGLEAVAAGTYPGKIVILPDCPDLPLTPFDPELLWPELAATLDECGGRTAATEQYLRNCRRPQ